MQKKGKTTNIRYSIGNQRSDQSSFLIKKAASLLVSISDDISLVKNTLGDGVEGHQYVRAVFAMQVHIVAGCACEAQVAHMHILEGWPRTCWHLALRRILSKDARNALPFANGTRSFDVVVVVALLVLRVVVPASFLHVQGLWQGAFQLPCLPPNETNTPFQ